MSNATDNTDPRPCSCCGGAAVVHGLVVDLGDEFGSRILGTDTCPVCDGTGEEPAREHFDVQAEWLAAAEDDANACAPAYSGQCPF